MLTLSFSVRNVGLCLGACMLLTACGEGWEVIKTQDYFPYGNQRTAGSGVAYVLARMLPEHDMKLELTAALPAELPDENAHDGVLDADDVFKKALRK